MSLQINSFEFGEFRLEAAKRVLLRQGKPVALTPKALQLLFLLIEQHGQIVEKKDLMNAIWADSFVEESNLTFTVSLLRKTLEDDKKTSRFIETVPKRGYRFIADVREISESDLLTAEEITSANAAPKYKKSLMFFVIFFAFGATIFVGSWYALNKKSAESLPIFNAPFTLEKISDSGKVYSAVISPDGKMAAYTNEVGGKQSLWLKQFDANGTNSQIVPPSDDIYFKLAFAPGGNFIYFARKPKNESSEPGLYRVSIFGGVPEKIVNNSIGGFSLSPDGGKVSFVRCAYRDDEFCSLWIADARDGKNETKIANRPRPMRIGDNDFAPDGRRIIFTVGQSENAGSEFGLMEIDLETGAEREFSAEKFFHIRQIAWLPDQSGLLLTASRIPNKNFRIWQISATTGEAAPLTKDAENYSNISIDKQANTISATKFKEDFHLRLFDLQSPNLNAGKDLTSAFTASFAANGKIVFSSPMAGNDEIWSMNTDGSEQRQLTNTTADEFLPVVSADGDSIFFTSNRTGEMHVWRMNFDGSNQTQITEKNGGMPMAISPDGKWLYYLHSTERTLWRVSTGGGGEQIVIKKEKNRFALSPDGATVVYGEKQTDGKFFILASASDGQPTRTIKYPDSTMMLHEIAFLPDGKSLIYVLSDSEYENYTLWQQPLGDEKPAQKIGDLGNEEVAAFAVAPDGKNFLIIQGSWKHDAVLLKGLK